MILKLIAETQRTKPSKGWKISVTTPSPKVFESALIRDIPIEESQEQIAALLDEVHAGHEIRTWERSVDNHFVHVTGEDSQWIDQGYVSIESVTHDMVVLRSFATKRAEDPAYVMGLLAGRFCAMLLTHYAMDVKTIHITPA